MVVVGLALSFRFRLAFLSAVMVGLVGDSLVSRQIGAYTFALLLVVLAVSLLVTRFVSHRTTISVIGTNAVAFILFSLTIFVVEAVDRAISGGPFLHPASILAATYVVLALPIQCGVVLAARWLADLAGDRLKKLILVASEFDKL